jgi:hypothetical protein
MIEFFVEVGSGFRARRSIGHAKIKARLRAWFQPETASGLYS